MKIKLWVRKSRLYAQPDEIEAALKDDSKCGPIVFLRTKANPYDIKEPYYIVKVGRLVKP